jgi:hypothetical protein
MLASVPSATSIKPEGLSYKAMASGIALRVGNQAKNACLGTKCNIHQT